MGILQYAKKSLLSVAVVGLVSFSIDIGAKDQDKKKDDLKINVKTARYELTKEPEYKDTPKYALTVWGEKKIWLVLDGEDVYADMNSNGDLTEEDELCTFVKRPTSSWKDSKFKGENFNFKITSTGGGYQFWPTHDSRQYSMAKSGGFKFVKDKSKASIYHFGGPLRISFKKEYHDNSLSKSEKFTLRLSLMTDYKGVVPVEMGSFSVKNMHPIAKVTYTDDNDKEFTKTYSLERRCWGVIFYDFVEVPEKAALGMAKVEFSLKSFDKREIKNEQYEIMIVRWGGEIWNFSLVYAF